MFDEDPDQAQNPSGHTMPKVRPVSLISEHSLANAPKNWLFTVSYKHIAGALLLPALGGSVRQEPNPVQYVIQKLYGVNPATGSRRLAAVTAKDLARRLR